MAEEKKDEKKEDQGEKKPASKGSLIGTIIMVLVVLICGAGGYGLSFIFAKGEASPEDAQVQEEPSDAVENLLSNSDEAQPWMFEMSPIIANLDEPGATRMIRITVMVEMSADLDETEGMLFLGKKEPYLRDWVSTYLSGLTLDKVGGSGNRERIKLSIFEKFGEILFPGAKSYVKKILIKDYAIQ